MKGFLKSQARGALIRGSAILGIGAANLIAPRVLGAEQYGLSISVLAIPLAIQGLLEPTVASLTIKWLGAEENRRRMAVLRNKSIGFVLIGLLSSPVYAWIILESLPGWEFLSIIVMLAIFLILFVANTHLMGLAYALHEYRALLCISCIRGVSFPLLLIVLGQWGVSGHLMSLCLWQAVRMGLFFVSPSLRNHSFALATEASEGEQISLKNDYLPAMAPRLTVVFLNTVSVMIGCLFMSPVNIACFKVTLTLIGLAKYFLPVSPEMLQVALTQNNQEEGKSENGNAILFLIALFLAACLLAGVMYLIGDRIRLFLLGPVEGADAFNIMFLGMPFFYLISPLSAYLFAMEKTKALIGGFLLASCCIGMSILAGELALGFTIGSIVYVAAAVTAQSQLGSRQIVRLIHLWRKWGLSAE